MEKYSDQIYQFLNRRLNDNELARDLTQDILMKLIQNKSQLSSVENLDAWIYRVARNRLIDHTRKKREERLYNSLAVPADPKEVDFLDGINACLETIIREYDDEKAGIFLQIFSGELTQKEAALQLDIPYSTLKSRVQKVREDVFNRFLKECCKLIYNNDGEVINCRPIYRDEGCCSE